MSAYSVQEPMLVPSVGPTVLLFFESALQPSACPRNALIGHGIAIAAGWGSLAAFGLLNNPSALSAGIGPAYVGSAAISVALTAFIKHWVKAAHPPAGATALIISLGLLRTPEQVGSLADSALADRPVVVKGMRGDAGSRCQAHEFGLEADQPACGNGEFQSRTALAVRHYIAHLRTALVQTAQTPSTPKACCRFVRRRTKTQ